MIRSVLLMTLAAGSTLAANRQIFPKSYFNSFHHRHAVLARIAPGDVVSTRTIDASGRDENGKAVGEPSNPLTGPFFIEGAEPGDALAVTFRKIAMNRDWGWSAYRLGLFSLSANAIEGVYPNHYKEGSVLPGRANVVRWDIDRAKKTVKLRDPASKVHALEFPARPMLGCVGVAAAGDFGPTSGISGPYGGNMDYNEVVDGATVVLPVYHPGALLFVGDGHALQSDGEPTGTGVETSMDVEFTVELRKRANIGNPRLENAEFIVSIGSQPEFVSPLDRTLQIATSDMVVWLTKEYGMEPWAAHMLIGYQGKYDVITVGGSMGLRIPRKSLPRR